MGTALIAWLAVRWAVAKFKQEKTWEKELQLYGRILASIREMQFVNELWKAEVYCGFEPAPAYSAQLQQSYIDAKRNLDEAIAMSSLVLSEASFTALAKFQAEVETFRAEDQFLTYEGVGSILNMAQIEIAELGRLELR